MALRVPVAVAAVAAVVKTAPFLVDVFIVERVVAPAVAAAAAVAAVVR